MQYGSLVPELDKNTQHHPHVNSIMTPDTRSNTWEHAQNALQGSLKVINKQFSSNFNRSYFNNALEMLAQKHYLYNTQMQFLFFLNFS